MSPTSRVMPQGWTIARLDALAVVIRGVTYDKSVAQNEAGTGLLPLLRATNIQDRLELSDFVFIPSILVQPQQFLRVNDIVVATSSGSRKIVGKTAQLRAPFEGTFGAFCAVVRPTPGAVEPRFLALFFTSADYRTRISDLAAGVNINNLKREHLESQLIPLPPLKEQLRIVAAVDEHLSDLDASVAALERVQRNLNRYRASMLMAAVEGRLVPTDAEPPRSSSEHAGIGAVNVPSSWKWTTLGGLAATVTSGSRGWAEHYSESGPIFIRAQDIKTDDLLLKDAAHVSLPVNAEGTRTRVSPADILITITGANVTKSAIIVGDIGEAYVSQHVALVRLKDSAFAAFVYWWIVSPANGRRFLEGAAYGAGKPGLNLKQIKDMPIPLPTLPEQRQIVSEIDARLSLIGQTEATVAADLRRADRLRQSILKRAFEGKLVPQDPKDAPAIVFIEQSKKDQTGAAPAPKALSRSKKLLARQQNAN
jgi:type I restriction enzyme S subunit